MLKKQLMNWGNFFFEIGNEQLVPELSKHINIALEKFKEMQNEDDELNEIIIADVDEKLFAFAIGDGSELNSKEDESVFYIAKSENFNECMELIKHICFGNHSEGYLSLDSEVYHWIGDAMPDIDEDMSVTIYGGYYYGETEVDPFWES